MTDSTDSRPLPPSGEDRYAWQEAVTGFGAEGQKRLRDATVLVSRVGGVGGTAAIYLAAAGIGRLILAHAGPLRLDDLNRQILMNTPGLGQSRADVATATLASLNPDVAVEAVPENISPENALSLVRRCDLVVSAAPLFSERLAMNAAAVASSSRSRRYSLRNPERYRDIAAPIKKGVP